MKRMKLFALSLLMGVALFSCGDDYDDTALKNEIDDLKSRVEKLEDWCDSANGQISALQGLVSAMEQNDYITGVTPVTEGTKETGYIITFAKSDPITILHGKNGTDGTDGDAGITPIIGAKQDTDGNYYWTIKTGDEDSVWMTDAEGNKIRTTGDDAKAVKPVISVDTDTDGKLYWKIDGEWLLDKENKKVPATGEKGDKGDTGATGGSGSSGSQGPQGPKGDAVFADNGVKVDAAGYVTFKLADGTTTFTVPRSVAISIGTNGKFYYTDATKVVPITLPTNFTEKDYASIMAEVKSSYGTSINIKTRTDDTSWKVEVTPPTFNDKGEYTAGSAKVTLTAPTDIADNANAWLEVTILDAKGKKSTAACVIVTGVTPVATSDALNTALKADGGTSEDPVKIVLEDDINVLSNPPAAIGGIKELDGNGKTLTNGLFNISSENDNASVLTVTNTQLENPQLSVGDKGSLTLGEGVSITSTSTSTPITVAGSGEVTVNGATFTGATTDDFRWISVGEGTSSASGRNAGNTAATLKLENITISKPNDFILITSNGQLQIQPDGIKKAFKLYLNNIKSSEFSINPTAGTLTDSDLNMLSIHANSTIDGSSAANGDKYELILESGSIKLKKKDVPITTYETLKEAIDAATGTAADPVKITLAADIEVPPPSGADEYSIELPASKHVWIDGGESKHKLTRSDSYVIFNMKDGASMKLTNLTMGDENKLRREFIFVGPNATLTLGDGFKLTGGMFINYGITVHGTLIIDKGAEITENKGESPLSIGNSGVLKLKGGFIGGNSGETDITLFNTLTTLETNLPKGFSCSLFLAEFLNADKTVAHSTVISGTESYTLTSADLACFKLTRLTDGLGTKGDVNNYELYLDEGENAIKLKKSPPTSGTIDLTDKSVAEMKAIIKETLEAGYTDLKLIGPIENSGIGGEQGLFSGNEKVKTIDLTQVTEWEAVGCSGNGFTSLIGLPQHAFVNCTSLTEIKLPAGVKAIGNNACQGCTALNSINLGEITHIGMQAFEGCEKLASVDLPKAIILYIRSFAKSGLTAVTLPVATTVENRVFMDCTALEMLNLPAATAFGDYLTSGCSKLTKINAVAAGDFVDDSYSNRKSIKGATVFGNEDASQTQFVAGSCDLTLNPDKKQNGGGKPAVEGDKSWAGVTWQSISYAD